MFLFFICKTCKRRRQDKVSTRSRVLIAPVKYIKMLWPNTHTHIHTHTHPQYTSLLRSSSITAIMGNVAKGRRKQMRGHIFITYWAKWRKKERGSKITRDAHNKSHSSCYSACQFLLRWTTLKDSNLWSVTCMKSYHKTFSDTFFTGSLHFFLCILTTADQFVILWTCKNIIFHSS